MYYKASKISLKFSQFVPFTLLYIGWTFYKAWVGGVYSTVTVRQTLNTLFKPGVLNREGPPGWAEHPLRTSGFEIKLNGE